MQKYLDFNDLLHLLKKLKSKSDEFVKLSERDYKILLENTIKIEALKIAGIEKMAIYKAMEHVLNNQQSIYS